jgi:hypothetical protein
MADCVHTTPLVSERVDGALEGVAICVQTASIQIDGDASDSPFFQSGDRRMPAPGAVERAMGEDECFVQLSVS